MSLATRCTHCGTIFKVVQDQLKVSEGWVRCGRCHEVFHAESTLFDLDKDPPPPRVTAPASESPPAATPTAAFDPTPTDEPGTEPPDSTLDAPSSTFAQTEPAPLEESGWPDEATPTPDETWPAAQEPRLDDLMSAPSDLAPEALQETPDTPEADAATWPSNDDLLTPPVATWPARGSLPPPRTAPIEATTEFELDTAIDGPPLNAEPQPTEVSAPVAAQATPSTDDAGLNLTLAVQPQRWQPEPPDSTNLPETDEADALDSRYLLPSPRERKPAYLRQKGPEFADAQFPSDALLDEDPWEPAPMPPVPAATTPAKAPAPAFGAALGAALGGLRPSQPPTSAPSPTPQANAPRADAGASGLDDSLPTTQPSRFGEDFVPETAVEPPSQRKGKPGTRAGQPTPEFMKRAQRQAFWRHPAVRVALSVAALGLTFGLALQMGHQFRDLLAAYHPPLRPYLAQWCQAVGCTLQPPLRLEALQVESATLVRATSDGPDRYRLAVVVHNKAPIELAWPHVDLTLTDANGAVIARRAFSPSDAEWLDSADVKADAAQRPAGAASIPAAVPSVRSTTLLWQLRAPSLQPAGYTAELFYP